MLNYHERGKSLDERVKEDNMDKKIREAESWYDENRGLYERFSREVEEIITKILETKGIPFQSVTYRVKEKTSYLNKCRNEKYTNPVEQIMDVSGIRIIAYTNQDVLDICKVLQEEFLIDEDNSINKADVLETDKVGYLSVHYILQLNEKRLALAENEVYAKLKSEVQVRTLLQHAWAEIEHDRNYKFAGVLPKEIKRRFHLIAGVLEMMDREFDNLSKDIAEYALTMKKSVEQGIYDLNIDSKSLEQYVLKRFEGEEGIKACYNGEIVSESVVQELSKFGYKTIEDIENDLNEVGEVFDGEDTYIGVLRNLMIIKDCDRYFKDAFNFHWMATSKRDVEFWKEKGVSNIEKYLYMYEMHIE